MENLKAQVLATALAMNASGINRGSAGNVSARCEGGFVITPTGMAYAECVADDMVWLPLKDSSSPVGAGVQCRLSTIFMLHIQMPVPSFIPTLHSPRR